MCLAKGFLSGVSDLFTTFGLLENYFLPQLAVYQFKTILNATYRTVITVTTVLCTYELVF